MVLTCEDIKATDALLHIIEMTPILVLTRLVTTVVTIPLPWDVNWFFLSLIDDSISQVPLPWVLTGDDIDQVPQDKSWLVTLLEGPNRDPWRNVTQCFTCVTLATPTKRCSIFSYAYCRFSGFQIAHRALQRKGNSARRNVHLVRIFAIHS